jgi:hypothetical protein
VGLTRRGARGSIDCHVRMTMESSDLADPHCVWREASPGGVYRSTSVSQMPLSSGRTGEAIPVRLKAHDRECRLLRYAINSR